jgi:probable HAF family extracellular repeat protein
MARRLGLLAVVGVLVMVASACRAVPDPLEDIGTLGSSLAFAQGVNDRGVIVGSSARTDPPGTNVEAFFYEPTTGEMAGLGVLVPGSPSIAVDVNNNDVAVGSANVWSPVGERQHAVAWDPGGGITDLNDVLGFWHESAATAVNDDNVVVGWAIRYFGEDFPVIIASLHFAYDLDTGVLTPLPISAADISDTGIVAGIDDGHAATYDMNTGTVNDLGTLGGATSHANAVNDDGLVVGQSHTAGNQFHAFVYDPDTDVMSDLGTLGTTYSEAFGVNDDGNVVGRASGGDAHGFFSWSFGRSMTDVGTLPGGSFTIAYDINNSNLVVGSANVLGSTRSWQTTIQFVPHEDP